MIPNETKLISTGPGQKEARVAWCMQGAQAEALFDGSCRGLHLVILYGLALAREGWIEIVYLEVADFGDSK